MIQSMYDVVGQRGRSVKLWTGIDPHAILMDPTSGVNYFNDFAVFPKHSSTGAAAVTAQLGDFSAFLSQGGAIAHSTTEAGGVLTLSSDGDNESVTLLGGAGAILLSTSCKLAVFEARIRLSSVADANTGAFVGLFDPGLAATDVPLTDAGALTDNNYIGFHRLEGDGDQIDAVYRASGQTAQTAKADAMVTALTDRWVKVGFRYDLSAPNEKRITYFIDDVALETFTTATQAAAATFPTAASLAPIISINNATGSSPGTLKIDWIALAQLF